MLAHLKRNLVLRKYEPLQVKLVHELKATFARLNCLRKTNERKRIIDNLPVNQKAVYCSFHNTNTTAKEIPTCEEVESYWTNVWGKK